MKVVSKLLSYAGKVYSSGSKAISKGTQYGTQEVKDLLKNHTQIGKRLREGVHSAREAVKHTINKIGKNSSETYEKYVHRVENNGFSIAKKLSNDEKFVSTYNRYAEKTGLGALELGAKSDEQIFQELIEHSGVGPTKFAQIISSNEAIMSKIQNPALKQAIKNTRSACSFSRSMEEAQQVLATSFPRKGYAIEGELSAGTIGAAYKIRKPDGSLGVLKMLKKGVDKEQLELEESVFTRVLKELSDNPQEFNKNKSMLKNWYRDWAEELNFTTEYNYNKMLANGAKRFKVADITDISKDGRCIVMNMAEGIQMNKLVKMLSDYKANPAEFAQKYSKEISKNPWLANPEKVMKELPTTLLKTFDEQFMFMKKGGKSLMHGDPHTGNFFITADKKGRLIPEFIDTGNCVARSSAQIKADINFFTNYFVGNSEGVAKYFVEQCGYTRANKSAVIKKVAKEIQENIFGKQQNITKFSDVQNNITAILEKNGLHVSTENATAMKAQMQFFTAVAEAGKLSGQSLNIATVLKDIPQASWGMIKTGTNPWSSIKEALKFAYKNQKQAVGTAYQFTIKDVESLSKAKEFSALA